MTTVGLPHSQTRIKLTTRQSGDELYAKFVIEDGERNGDGGKNSEDGDEGESESESESEGEAQSKAEDKAERGEGDGNCDDSLSESGEYMGTNQTMSEFVIPQGFVCLKRIFLDDAIQVNLSYAQDHVFHAASSTRLGTHFDSSSCSSVKGKSPYSTSHRSGVSIYEPTIE